MPAVTPIPIAKNVAVRIKKIIPRLLANSRPTEETFVQCGHLASDLFSILKENVCMQWPHETRHIPGIDGKLFELLGPAEAGARLMILLQLGRGQAILKDDALHIRRQLQGQRTYFLPGAAFLIGVASLH